MRAAFKIPKQDPGRTAAIQKATLLAAQVPLEAAKKSFRVAELALEAAQSGNKNAITDAGSAVNLAVAAINSAAYNVRINLSDQEIGHNDQQNQDCTSKYKFLHSSELEINELASIQHSGQQNDKNDNQV